jgi:hypothetical protein
MIITSMSERRPSISKSENKMTALRLIGNDNYGKPRQAYADKLFAMDDDAFLTEAEQTIWLSAYANNNPRSDYHWQADACYDEATRRGKPELYRKAWKLASNSCE